MLTRRELIFGIAGAAAFAGVDDEVGAILARIRPPVFPARDFPITKYGAVGDGAKDCTDAIRKAIAACAAAGGGRVSVPKGVFLTGPVHLKSNVNLLVDGTLRFSRDSKHYLPLVFSRWEGMECMNYSPFIYAYEQTNVAITGSGILDGQASDEAWWPWKGQTRHGWKNGHPNQLQARNSLIAMVEKSTPVTQRVFGEGACLRPQFIQPYKCRNVLIQGVTIVNSPMWEIHPVLCSNVSVLQVRIATHGPNNDGCNPESCRDVLIQDCEFDTGDDCIAIKSGRNQDGRRVPVPSENIVVASCSMKAGHGGVTIGSEISAGVRNVYIDNCRMSSPDLNSALRFKNNATRGGVIEHIRARNVTVGQVGVALEVDFLYEEGARGGLKPVVRDVHINGLRCAEAKSPWVLRGLPGAPVESVTLEDCTFDKAAKAGIAEHVQGLTLKNVRINGKLQS